MWTIQEHLHFLLGLRTFGRDWNAISQYIETKNLDQIRSHA
jgi:SHAQKYF class myb-like DNA-binding protein